MNVLIISTNRNLLPIPVMPVGACMVATAAKRSGHNVRVLDLLFEKEPLSAVRAAVTGFRPDVIGLSIRNIDNNDMQDPVFFIEEIIKLAELIQRISESTVVLGGAAVGVMPEELLRATGADIAVTGDGEIVFPELLDRISRREQMKGTPGTAHIENNIFVQVPREASTGYSRDCPQPDFPDWIRVKRYLSNCATAPVQTKLGCQFRCIYCTYRKIEGSSYRFLDPKKVVNLIENYAASGLRDIEFVDNVFNFPYEQAAGLCKRLAGIRPQPRFYSMELNPMYVDNHLLGLMENVGFRGIGITAESASDKMLESLRKGYTSGDVARAAECAGRSKVPCFWMFLLGGPGESESTVMETLDFAEKIIRPGDTVFFNIGIRIYPGTELEAIARKQGVLTISPKNMLAPVFYFSPDLEYNWLRSRIKLAMDRHMNFISADSLGLPYLPRLHRIGYRLGMRSPLWKYTRFIRRGLRMIGAEA